MSSSTAGLSSCFLEYRCFPKDEARILKFGRRDGNVLGVRGSVNSSWQSMQFGKPKWKRVDKTYHLSVLGASGFSSFEGVSPSLQTHIEHPSSNRRVQKDRCVVLRAADTSAGGFDALRKLNMDKVVDAVGKRWESLPQPIKGFPWAKAVGNFFETLLELVFAVAKYLCVPLLAVSSLSEMSYCAHERKMKFVPIPLLAGIAVAEVLNETATEIYSELKEGEFPWHLLSIAIFFTLLKLPGPYYPYWGRIFIPHFANGVLWRTLWLTVLWYRRPRNASETTRATSVGEIQSEEKKL